LDLESESFGYIEDIKIKMPQVNISASSSSLFSKKRNRGSVAIPTGIWGEVRCKLINICGEFVDRNWFSELIPIVNDGEKTITLKAPSVFFKDWIEQNYRSLIERVLAPQNFKLAEVIV
jgi:hypothetical protein